MKSNELYARITDTIIELMETHGSDWTRPWVSHRGGTHRNILSDAPYHGINVLLLGLTACQKGFDTPLWGTYRQWNAKGGQVRKGEKGTLGVFYRALQLGEDDDARTVPMIRHFALFNVDQVDGVAIAPPAPVPEPERIRAADSFVTKTGACIHEGGDRACYSPSADQIRVPAMSSFTSQEAYYSTLLHELSHWTGHRTRLDRRQGMESRFGDSAYAMEELVAELGAAFLAISLGLNHEPTADNAKYLNNWLAVLKNDQRAIATASSKAQQAADYLVGLQGAEGASGACEAA